jgi:hypothetical protein
MALLTTLAYMRAAEKVAVKEHRTVAMRAVELGWTKVD